MTNLKIFTLLFFAIAASAADLEEHHTPTAEPFAFADFSWLTGNNRQKYALMETKYFTGQFMLDANYTYSFNKPQDHTIDGSCEVGRHHEVQVQQLGVGGDFHFENVRGRVMTQFGMYSQMTPRNDASPSRGQWNLADAYRYLSEAYGGYHFDALNGINIDAGIFMSYVGLFSYYQFENWAYQPSYVSANTPWFFNGLRMQIFLNEKLKIEPWLVNGWQSYGMVNESPGVGVAILWRPNGDLSVHSNNYVGSDTLGTPGRTRYHTDNSVQFKYHDAPANPVSKGALTLTLDAGCENGGGVHCGAQNFLGFMLYNRLWFQKDVFAMTLGGGAITNPGRYLVLIPPIDGATASTGTADFSAKPGDSFNAWDSSLTFDYMPSQFVTFRLEINHRAASVPYFVGSGGVTPPANQLGWKPDLRKTENRITGAMLVRL